MVGKQGWLRVAEVTLAAVIIFAALLSVIPNKKVTRETELTYLIQPVLESIARNETLRNKISTYNPATDFNIINETINKTLSSRGFKFEFGISPTNTIWQLSPDAKKETKGKNVYAFERFLSTNTTSFSLKKITLFVWR
jgi:hypothetical protein